MFCTSCDCQSHKLVYVGKARLCDECLYEYRQAESEYAHESYLDSLVGGNY